MFLAVSRTVGIWIALGGINLIGALHLSAADVSSASKHCLWRITNAPAPFYLLGSVHALQPSDYHRTPVIEEAINQSQQFFFEFDAEAWRGRDVDVTVADSGENKSQNLPLFTKDNYQRYERLAASPSLGDSDGAAISRIRPCRNAIRH